MQRKGLHSLASALRAGVVVGALVLFSAWLGMLTRMLWTEHAYVWIANALLLGVMIRFPALCNAGGWIGAAIGYVLADLLMGAELQWALAINFCNYVGVAAGYAVLSRLPVNIRKLAQPASVPCISGVAMVAAAVSGVAGVLLHLVEGRQGFWIATGSWFGFEFSNYLVLLPLILALPMKREGWQGELDQSFSLKHPQKILPGVALLVSFILMSEMGGPVAVAYPVSALLWCAISYPIFVTTVLTTVFSVSTLFFIWKGAIPGLLLEGPSQQIALPVRIGVALIALGPIMVATVMAARNRLLVRLKYLAEHDHLTGLYNRHAFTERAQRLLTRHNRPGQSHAVMMMDIDHFKRINDSFGHQAGDTLLSSFARVVQARLRRQDVLGRSGGEEFAVLLPDCRLDQACAIAERIRAQIEQEEWVIGTNQTQPVTVSIGVAATDASKGLGLQELLGQADQALYEAKAQGRNRVIWRQL